MGGFSLNVSKLLRMRLPHLPEIKFVMRTFCDSSFYLFPSTFLSFPMPTEKGTELVVICHGAVEK